MALTPASILADYTSGIGTQGATLKVNTSDKRIGIGTTNPQGTLQVGTGITMGSGIITATSFDANTASFSGNVSVGGTLTYEDVTNVDSVGVITARNGIRVGAGQSIGSDGALTYYGNGFNLTGIDATAIKDSAGGTVRVQANTSGAVVTGILTATALEQTQTYPTIRPTLDLNFAATKTLDRRITFTRDGVGTFTDDMGIVKYASNNVPRFDHDPITGESLGLLIEEARTNQILYSIIHTDNWNVSTGAILSNNTTETTAPDGTNTAGKWVPANGTTSWCSIYNNSVISVTSGTTYTYSMWAKATHSDYTGFNISGDVRDGGGITLTANFVLSGDGSVSGTYDSASITKYPNGWYRCVATATSDATTTEEPGFRCSANGDGTKGFYAWGYQVEAGAFATSYIPTSGSTATRAADFATIKGTNFTDFYNQNEGTLFGEFTIKDDTYSSAAIANINQEPGASYAYSIMFVEVGTANGYFGRTYKNSSGVNISNASSILNSLHPSTTPQTVSLGYTTATGGTLAAYWNGNFVSDSSDLSKVPTTLTNMRIGAGWNGTDVINAHIRKLSYYNKRLPNDQLQGLTA